MKSLAARFAKGVNRGLGRRGDECCARLHLKKAGRALGRTARVDPASSGSWFLGFRPGVSVPVVTTPPPVARPTTWLARVGWRRLGLLDPAEIRARARGLVVLARADGRDV
jgi:hypothetical protein